MISKKLTTWIASALLTLALAAPVALAQARASLRGSVVDEAGAVILGATVTLKDASGAQKTATSNADGAYAFNGLAPGKYMIHVTAAGFATSEDAPVDVAAGRRIFGRDRKSTRLNSSHRCISYAVFCLKKKKRAQHNTYTAQ